MTMSNKMLTTRTDVAAHAGEGVAEHGHGGLPRVRVHDRVLHALRAAERKHGGAALEPRHKGLHAGET